MNEKEGAWGCPPTGLEASKKKGRKRKKLKSIERKKKRVTTPRTKKRKWKRQ
jgi:hypothetical protein